MGLFNSPYFFCSFIEYLDVFGPLGNENGKGNYLFSLCLFLLGFYTQKEDIVIPFSPGFLS